MHGFTAKRVQEASGPGSPEAPRDSTARGRVEGLIGGPDPFDAVERAIREGDFDEIIVSTLPKKRSKWLRHDPIRRIDGLGLPVTAVVPGQQVAPSTQQSGGAPPQRRIPCGTPNTTSEQFSDMTGAAAGVGKQASQSSVTRRLHRTTCTSG
jgi:hypothetical protein